MFSFMSYNENKVINCVEQRIRSSCWKINSRKNHTLQTIDRSLRSYQQKMTKEENLIKQREAGSERK